MINQDLTREQSNELYYQILNDNDTEAMRRLCLEDLFFLLKVACKRVDLDRDWLYERCREVEASPNEHLDLWAREHYKSTIITFGKTIQDILKDPDITIGIFSHTRPIAKAFLSQIKRELESNDFLKALFPDVLWAEPARESPMWSLDGGIVVKRKSNPKEATIEAWGLVDGQPTSKHYKLMVFDDVVTRESVTTPEQIKKVTDAWALSLNLSSDGGVKRYIGTRYHANDTYKTMIDRGSAVLRIYPATENGEIGGNPVLMRKELLDQKLRDMGSYIFCSQMLQNPLADNAMGFDLEWLMYYNHLTDFKKWNFYLIVDPASEKKKGSDYTVMVVIGLAPDNNYYLVDAVRDRLNLTERTNWLFRLVKKWKPNKVGYEKYGMQSDIEHIKYVQERESYRFKIQELGGAMPKNDRIRRLVPIFENYRFFLPRKLPFMGADNKVHDFIQEFISDEYETFPISAHDDMLDCVARILDQDFNATFPKSDGSIFAVMPKKPDQYDPLSMTTQVSNNNYHPLAR